MSSLSATQADIATSRTVLLGIATPLAGVSMPADQVGTVVAIVSTRFGILSTDSSSGAVVRGNGSNLLWISGTAAQVNVKLATLTYASATAGSDDLSISVLAPNGILTNVVRSPVAVIPLIGEPSAANGVVYLDNGTLTLESRTLDGPNLNLREIAGSTTSTACVLINTTIGSHSQMSLRNDNGAGSVMPRVAVAGQVELDGSMTFAGNGAAVTLARGSTFLNQGSIAIDAHAAQFTGAGTLINNGVIIVTGDGTAGAMPRFDTSLSGSGILSLDGGATVEIGASVAADETIWLGAGANTLHLAQPGSFAGQIAGFSHNDTLVFDGATITGAVVHRAAETDSSVVTLFNGADTVGTIRFSAAEAGTVFSIGADAAGNPTLGLAQVGSAASNSLNVFRFFDAAHGTQLLTQNSLERDTIIASRPDLHYEGVGMHAIDPASADANASAIYRFFDVSNGTHFMTASASERDTLLGSRPDLVFEPSSTLFEHATAQAGDSAVYRFFDNQSGAHFFTANAGERASIMATRPDMIFEGVAFYAPTV